jgi:hypothetical protein
MGMAFFFVRGRILVRDAMNEIVLITDDKQGELVFRLDEEDTHFWYSEAGKMPLPELDLVPEDARDCACVSVALPLRIRPSVLAKFFDASPPALFREKVFFLEIRQEAGSDPNPGFYPAEGIM